MKKKIISLSILALSAISVYAQADEEALVFGYCGAYSSSLGSTDAKITEEKAAIEIPEDLAKTWAGALLTKVNIGYGQSSVDEITVFLAESLDSEPFYTQTATMEVEGGWNIVTLDSPYTIPEKGFFVGYSAKVNSPSDKPIGMDNIKTSNPYSSFVNTYDEWEEVGKFYGSVCIKIAMVGDNLPQNSVEVSDLKLPELVEVGQPFYAEFTIYNDGVKTVKEVALNCTVNGVSIENTEVSIENGPITSGEIGKVRVSGLKSDIGGKNQPVVIEVTCVNSQVEESYFDNKVSGTVNSADKSFRQQMVVEEFTGTWCGWCPIGLVGMAYMKENYGNEGFNGIAVHNGDEMQVPSYSSFATTFSEGQYPSALINRSIYILEPSIETLSYYFGELTKFPTYAGFTDLSATYINGNDGNPGEIAVSSTVEFSFDEQNARYAVAYVIVEDNVGPYTQTNYFSGGQEQLDGWSDKPSKVPDTYYNEVGRLIETTYGINGSVPSEIKAGTEYNYQRSLSCEYVENISECEIIALLLDKNTGEVVNSAKTSISNTNAGVGAIEKEDGKAVVYSLQGLKVLETDDATQIRNLRKGIYIINGKKVIL
ncbi:MAG: hypothetical protein J1F67_06235 [Muribaculaceae bacterium]|nr:hypothetical protein [Muribaculaceae bacterium]